MHPNQQVLQELNLNEPNPISLTNEEWTIIISEWFSKKIESRPNTSQIQLAKKIASHLGIELGNNMLEFYETFDLMEETLKNKKSRV